MSKHDKARKNAHKDEAVAAEKAGGRVTTAYEAMRERAGSTTQSTISGIEANPMAALLGALPLALGTGTGSELRRPLGITIVGGLMLSQLLTLYTTPVVYLYLDRLQVWFGAKRQVGPRLQTMLTDSPAAGD